jgi:iron-sulfur cluster insertion protein
MTEAAPAPLPSFSLSASAARRIAEIAAREGHAKPMLRVTVTGGGCSGFKYEYGFDATVNADDRLFERDGVSVVVDETSLGLLDKAQLDFKEDLMGSYFQFVNPNAKSACGCGASFSVD